MAVIGSNKSTLRGLNVAAGLYIEDIFGLIYSCSFVEMNVPPAPFETFTNSSAGDAFLDYYQRLRETGKYSDLEIEVSCCSYK